MRRAATDPARDRAVLHAGNTAAFEEIVAAMDAIQATRRPTARDDAAAFEVVFAVDRGVARPGLVEISVSA